MLAVQTIRRLEDLENLAPEWTDLCRADPSATPFQTPEWAIAWWRHLGRGKLHTIAVRHAGKLVGLAPLYVSRCPFPPFRRLSFLGTGKSDYLDILVAPVALETGSEPGDFRQTVLSQVLHQLWQSRAVWDYMDLQQLRSSSNAMGPLLEGSSEVSQHPHSTCPYLPLYGAEGLEGVPKRLRKNLRYSLRRLSEEGEVRFRVASQTTLAVDLEAFFRLHQSRWRSRGLPGVFSGGDIQSFHREVASGLLDKGVLRLRILERNGETLASALTYVMNGRAYYYGGGFDPKWATHSPGSLVVAEAIRSAAAEGCVEFDFLRGEEPYKLLWGCQVRRNQRLIAAGIAGASFAHRLPSLEARLERAGLSVLDRYVRLHRHSG